LQLKSILEENDVQGQTKKISSELFAKIDNDFQILFGGNEKTDLLHGLINRLLDRIK